MKRHKFEDESLVADLHVDNVDICISHKGKAIYKHKLNCLHLMEICDAFGEVDYPYSDFIKSRTFVNKRIKITGLIVNESSGDTCEHGYKDCSVCDSVSSEEIISIQSKNIDKLMQEKLQIIKDLEDLEFGIREQCPTDVEIHHEIKKIISTHKNK